MYSGEKSVLQFWMKLCASFAAWVMASEPSFLSLNWCSKFLANILAMSRGLFMVLSFSKSVVTRCLFLVSLVGRLNGSLFSSSIVCCSLLVFSFFDLVFNFVF